MELFEKLRLIIKNSKFISIISIIYIIMLALYSVIIIINNQLRSQNVHVTTDGEIVINGPVQTLPVGIILFAQICLTIAITLIVLSSTLSINVFMKLKRLSKDSVHGQEIYDNLIICSFLSIIFFGFIFSFILWIKSVKVSKNLENYYDYVDSLEFNENEVETKKRFSFFKRFKKQKDDFSNDEIDDNKQIEDWNIRDDDYYMNSDSYYNNQYPDNNKTYNSTQQSDYQESNDLYDEIYDDDDDTIYHYDNDYDDYDNEPYHDDGLGYYQDSQYGDNNDHRY
ncbi:hypothetical protein [Malacoplasma iowae]|uniref:Uncharacterized protein n=2 Tax=Malacoplasma iowae TaxID=2116 RepID=A0A084U473_MALIO|nr:hypothetical protein [Malacoplasma iowae]KFB07759.1 hypothetical protein P271_617 [Malacoplasma iowae DK-CPA]